MTDTTNLKIEADTDGITISQDCPSPEWSITGKGGRTDMVFISDDEFPAVFAAMKRHMNEINERASI
jgi:hypothetical protein